MYAYKQMSKQEMMQSILMDEDVLSMLSTEQDEDGIFQPLEKNIRLWMTMITKLF